MGVSEAIFLACFCSLGASALERECNGDGYFADPRNCRKFYYCVGPEYPPLLLPCPATMYFDAIKKSCVEKTADLVCGPVEQAEAERQKMWRPLDGRQKCGVWNADVDSYDMDLCWNIDLRGTAEPRLSTSCDGSCQIPECFCSARGTRIPFDFRPTEIPQLVMLTFTGPITEQYADVYLSLFGERENPDRCTMRATFFISHENTSYAQLHRLEAARHEIAMLSVTQTNSTSYWAHGSFSLWADEVLGVRSMIHRFAKIRHHELAGVRSPFPRIGAPDALLHMLYHFNLKYDSSIVVGPDDVPVWPYTLDHSPPHCCKMETCPSYSYPGLWEVPLNTLHSEWEVVEPCVQLDDCDFPKDDERSAIEEFLKENFLRHYSTNRAPLVLSFTSAWIMQPDRYEALDAFIRLLRERYPAVYFVSVGQTVAWMTKPTRLSHMRTFNMWSCPYCVPFCGMSSCTVDFPADKDRPTRTIEVCKQCPDSYPWLGNFDGSNEGNAYTLDGGYYTFI